MPVIQDELHFPKKEYCFLHCMYCFSATIKRLFWQAVVFNIKDVLRTELISEMTISEMFLVEHDFKYFLFTNLRKKRAVILTVSFS